MSKRVCKTPSCLKDAGKSSTNTTGVTRGEHEIFIRHFPNGTSIPSCIYCWQAIVIPASGRGGRYYAENSSHQKEKPKRFEANK